MHIILHQPEIPGNTGNIGRTCVATGTPLHLIEPLGFRLDEKSIRRAGMDYWQHLDVRRYTNFEEFKEKINSLKKFDRETYLSYLNDNYDYIQEELNTLKRLKKNERDINDFMYHFVSDQKQTKQLRYLHVPDIKLVTFEEEIEYIISENSVDRKSNMKDY